MSKRYLKTLVAFFILNSPTKHAPDFRDTEKT